MTKMKSVLFCLIGLALFVYGSEDHSDEDRDSDGENQVETRKPTKFDKETWQVTAALYKEVTKKENGNFVQSPLSLRSLMVMLNAGAEGKTAAEIQTHFKFRSDSSFVVQNHTKILESLQNQTLDKNSGVELLTASRIFANSKNANIREDYNTTVRSLGEIETLDFTNPQQVVEKTNKWVKNHTRGKISKLVEEKDFSGETAAVLLNAVYFKAPWKTPFDIKDTKPDYFHISESKTVKVDMMHISAEFPYIDLPEVEALVLPYKGDRMSMIIYLPHVGHQLSSLEEKLEHFVPSEVRNLAKPSEISVYLPKFNISSTLDLKPVLEGLGVREIFNRTAADFTKMTTTPEFHVSKVRQQTFIQVNEEGTEAAAATAGHGLGQTSVGIVFNVNRSFIFQIYDDVTGNILLGRITNPLGTALPEKRDNNGTETTTTPRNVHVTNPPLETNTTKTPTPHHNSTGSPSTSKQGSGQAKNNFMAPLLIFCIILLGGRKMW